MRHALSCALLLNLLAAACGSHDHQVPNSKASPPAGRDTLVVHSTLADTAGLAAHLRIIERKLGPLDPGIRDHLQAVEVTYYGFTDSSCTAIDTTRLCTGVLLVHACVAGEVRAIFEGLRRDRFPIAQVVPVNRYGLNADSTGWDDAASMADNNTSAFNYRGKAHVPETSKHAQGIAIDINPLLNPLEKQGPHGVVREPALGRYDPRRPGTLTRARIMKHLAPHGWTWGGRWQRPQDHQHIEKIHGRCAHLRERIR